MRRRSQRIGAEEIEERNRLAAQRQAGGDLPGALELASETLELARGSLDEDHPELAAAVNNVAAVRHVMGDHREAELMYREALEVYRRSSGERDPTVAVTLNNLGGLLREMGNHGEARPVFEEALALARGTLGDRDRFVARILSNLGLVLHEMGDYARAEPLYLEALDIQREVVGDRHPDIANTLNNLGGLRRDLGDVTEADIAFRKVLAIRREALGVRHPLVAITLGNLALLHHQRGSYAEAEPLYREALAIAGESLGDRHPLVAAVRLNLAGLHHGRGEYATAEPLYLEALGAAGDAFGRIHPYVAQGYNNLAALHHFQGQHPAAEVFSDEAVSIAREALGDRHPDLARMLHQAAAIRAAADRPGEALELLREAVGIEDRLAGEVIAIGSERQRLAFLAMLSEATDRFLSLVHTWFSEDVDTVGATLDLVLRRKAVGVEVLAAQRDEVLGGRHPDLAGRLRELAALRMRIATAAMAGPGPEGPEEHRRRLADWDREKEALEAELARRVPQIDMARRLRAADRAAVAAALPPDAALIELVRFDEFDFRAVPARGDPLWGAARYTAFVLGAGDPSGVRMVDLGDAGSIDGLIARYRAAVTGQGRDRAARGTEGDPVAPGGSERDVGAALREAVFDPLVPHLGGRTRLFLAPDGDLSTLPFEVLPTADGSRLIEAYAPSYVSTGRDVLRFAGDGGGGTAAPLVAAAPDFDLGGGSDGDAPPARRSRDLSAAIHFDPLEGTVAEGERVGGLVGAAPLLGGAALEAALKRARSPRILHVATHGFFLPDQPRPREDGPAPIDPEQAGPLRGAGMENPLLRSGLALAGANTFLEGGIPPPEAEDGILTAEDVTGLDLLGTELVVLSACETGLGEVRRGEGVFGLRRAFVLAGARTLVMSLWKVPDGPSAELMEAFYENLGKGMGRGESLREAQLAVAALYPPPWFWGAFICQGDPGPLREEE